MASVNSVILSGIVLSVPLCKNSSTMFRLRSEHSQNPAQDGRYEVEVIAWGVESQYASKLRLGDLINVEGSVHARVEELTRGKIYITFIKAKKISLVIPALCAVSDQIPSDNWSAGL